MSGLTNERQGMDYIPNSELDAGPCSNCGASWSRCLAGWPDTGDLGRHPAGVCCPECHSVDTHEADAARRRAEARRDASADTSADSAVIAAANARRRHRDAAKGIIDGCSDAGRGINGRSYWALIERVIKLLEEQERLRDELSRTAQQGGGEIDVLKQRIIDLERAQEARARRIRELAAQRDAAELENERLADRLNHAERSTTSLLQTMTTDQLVGEIRRRLNT